MTTSKKVSVPFRGSCSEMAESGVDVKLLEEFPSPFGVRVLKCCLQLSLTQSVIRFPSPFGVRVLKSFRPDYRKLQGKVSVPFRGSCSEIIRAWGESPDSREFPSPFGVRVLK